MEILSELVKRIEFKKDLAMTGTTNFTTQTIWALIFFPTNF